MTSAEEKKKLAYYELPAGLTMPFASVSVLIM
jgi:hypothetical protein